MAETERHVRLTALFLIIFFHGVIDVVSSVSGRKTIHIANDDRAQSGPTIFDAKDGFQNLNFPEFQHDSSRWKRDASAERTNITTNLTRLNDSHQQLMVHWVGAGSDVIICLARTSATLLPSVPSSVYISYDYGDTFVDKTASFALNSSNNSFASLDKFYTHPKFVNHVVFSDAQNKVIYTSTDAGLHITRVNLDFHPSDISLHEDESFTFLAHDKMDPMRNLWLTKDFGQTWQLVQSSVKAYFWSGPSNFSPQPATIPIKGYQFTNDTSLMLYVERVEPSGRSTVLASPTLFVDPKDKVVLLTDVEDFQLKNEFMFASKSVGKNNLDLYVSLRRGPFVKALFESELDRQDFHIADVSDGQIFVAVSHTDSLAHLYSSQSMSTNKIIFSLSLEKILCFFPNSTWKDTWLSEVTEESFADLHKVDGLRGIYIASQVFGNGRGGPNNIGPENLLTVITFDRGGEWRPLKAPQFDDDGVKINCEETDGCSLHLSQKFNQLYPSTRAIPIMSSKSAPGLIMATGTVGKSLKGHLGVFLSRDGGLTWRQLLKDYYFFNFGDHGGVLVAVKYFKSQGETRELLYSTDEGEKFNSYQFHAEDMRVYGLMTEPGGNTTIFTMFGSLSGQHQWLIVKVDLRNAFAYPCSADDYKFWSPGLGGKVPCLMGRTETYQRKIAHSNCYNGRQYERPVRMEVCACDREDFECDFGFLPNMAVHDCVRNKTLTDIYKPPSTCVPGGWYSRTKGYSKIPGDVCVGGKESQYLPDVLPCPLQEKKEFLLIAQRDKLVRVDLKDNSLEVLPISNLKNVIAVEFDMRNNCVYWADIVHDVISRQCLSDGLSQVEVLIENNVQSIEGMALDWVSNHLYFVDGVRAEIEVIRTDLNNQGRMRRTILRKPDVKKPRGVAVHPMAGYLYWTDWAPGEPSLSRSNLDGTDLRRLFTKPKVEWPNGVTIDHIAERVYWVDARQDYIASCDLEGKAFNLIIHHDDRVSHPFAVAVFKDNMYWDDWKQNSIFVADKDHGVDIKLVLGNLTGLMDLKVFAHSVQEGTNACSNKTNCTHLCLGAPRGEHVCLCPQGMDLSNDQCWCPGHYPLLSNGTCAPVAQTCAPTQFRCASKLCIPKLWQCDGDNDCGDNSDELGCTKTTCAGNLFTCPNGQCIPMAWKCDFDPDCPDGADEKNCSYQQCKHDEFRCTNGRCISKRWTCDFENDCGDNSDEDPERCKVAPGQRKCKPEEFRCGDACIPTTWRCDGDKDCADNEDEANCISDHCQKWQFQCANKKCIFEAWRCDGDDDCGDNTDETNCTVVKNTTTPRPTILPGNSTCRQWMFPCGNGKCIPYWWKCDKVKDCEDESDEMGCSDDHHNNQPPVTPPAIPPSGSCKDHQFQCFSGECIQDSWVCDGMMDCDSDEDEQNCRTETNCTPDQFMCRTDGSCVALKQVCDGKQNCPDGSDEDGCGTDNYHPQGLPDSGGPSCFPGFFSCDASRCIPLSQFCDQHQDCFDGTDESECSPSTPRVYQVMELGVDERSLNSTSLLLYWWIPLPVNVRFEFLPSIRETQHGGWTNKTWVTDSEYHFSDLLPYTAYNMTVYVRLRNNTQKVFPPAKYVVSTTSQGVPSPPRNVTVVQTTATSVDLSWLPPASPNGPIISYTVGMTPPVPPVLKTVAGPVDQVTIKSEFLPGQHYSFWLVAKNEVAGSNNSEVVTILFDPDANIDAVEGLVVEKVSTDTVKLSWKPLRSVDGYRVVTELHLSTQIRLPYLPVRVETHNTTTNSITVQGLSPGESYKFEVAGYRKTYLGPLSTVMATTTGQPLPLVQGLVAKITSGDAFTVTLTWGTPKYPTTVAKWLYGLYYSVNFYDLYEKDQLKTMAQSVTIGNLSSCETYLFAVCLVGPLGMGPMQEPITLTTPFDRNAPPLHVTVSHASDDENVMIVEWEPSCKNIDAIAYEIVVTELNKNLSSSITLLATKGSLMRHRINTHYGGRYSVTVATNSSQATPSTPQFYNAPSIQPPHQVQVWPDRNGNYVVMWNAKSLPAALTADTVKYKVLVSEGSELNESTARTFLVAKPPFTFSEVKDATMYSFAVKLVTPDGYHSELSEVNSIESPAAGLVLSTSSLVGVVVPVLLLIVALSGVLAFFVIRHRRLQNSFSSFANSHYDTRSGSTTFGGADGLGGAFIDDEDSPVIRGFSDDEPLVMA